MKISTPDLCDAHPNLVRIAAPIFQNFGGQTSFGGPIVTIKCFEDNSRVKELVNAAGQGQVLVVDGQGSLRCALLGDQLAAKAADNGWAGLVINGAIRDVDEIGQMSIGVKALGVVPIKSVRKGIGDINVPVAFGGITFQPGEYVYADNNGIIVSSTELK